MVDFPDGVTATEPTVLLGADNSGAAKTPISAKGRTLIAASDTEPFTAAEKSKLQGAALDSGVVHLTGNETIGGRKAFTASVNTARVVLTDAVSIATDALLGNAFEVTLTDNRTLANPTNLAAGTTYLWLIRQDGVGGHTLAYGNLFTWPGGTVPTLSTAADAVDMICAYYDGTKLRANMLKAFA